MISIHVSAVHNRKPNALSLVQVWDRDACGAAQKNCSLWVADSIASCRVVSTSWSRSTLRSQAAFGGASGRGALSLKDQPIGGQITYHRDTFSHCHSLSLAGLLLDRRSGLREGPAEYRRRTTDYKAVTLLHLHCFKD